MTIQKHATDIPSSVNRRATYDRLVPNGSDTGSFTGTWRT